MRAKGWRIEGFPPDLPQFVLITVPHTSNWDFFLGVAAMFAIGFRASWLGKHTLFEGPFGWYMRWLGGIPVHRDRNERVVGQAIAAFRAQDKLLLTISPEGTRHATPGWKSGFYFIARGAGVPIVPVAFDYSTRTLRILPVFFPTADTAKDWDHLGSLFHSGMARYPELYTTPGPPPTDPS